MVSYSESYRFFVYGLLRNNWEYNFSKNGNDQRNVLSLLCFFFLLEKHQFLLVNLPLCLLNFAIKLQCHLLGITKSISNLEDSFSRSNSNLIHHLCVCVYIWWWWSWWYIVFLINQFCTPIYHFKLFSIFRCSKYNFAL